MRHTECIITGCDFIDPNSGRWVHGDLFLCGDTYIFNAVMTRNLDKLEMNPAWQFGDRKYADSRNAISCTDGSYFEKRGVIIFARESAEMNDAAIRYLAKFPEYRPNKS